MITALLSAGALLALGFILVLILDRLLGAPDRTNPRSRTYRP